LEKKKAFVPYPTKEEGDLRKLFREMQDYGKINCSFEVFCQIYIDWHHCIFPGENVMTVSDFFNNDWYPDFVNYISNRDV